MAAETARTEPLDDDARYLAASGREARWDGRFFLGVTTTGIYCRPSCPARKPLRRNAVFFPSAAAAVAAGFRACKRCRPDALPGSRGWDHRSDLAARAVRLIRDGALDELGVAGLARRLAVSERHLSRVLVAEVGAGPQQLGRTRRAQLARTLVEQTRMPLVDVAFAAGFGSLRQFNAVFVEEFGAAPSTLRRPAAPASTPPRSRRRGESGTVALRAREPGEGGNETEAGPGDEPASDAAPSVTLRLRHRAPLAQQPLRGFLRAHAVPGVERLDEASATHTRVIAAPHGPALAVIDWAASGAEHVTVRIQPSDLADLTAIVARLRRWLDLDADPALVDEALSADPLLAPLVAAQPGLRLPGSLDGAETALLTVLGQQVSLAAARRFAGRLVEALGAPGPDGLRVFPTSQAVADADTETLRAAIGLTGARVRTLQALAGALAGGLELSPGADRDHARAALLAIPGIGPWTADYIALRALGDPDAFTADDLVLKKALGVTSARDALARAHGWRPWRGYALLRLWSSRAYD